MITPTDATDLAASAPVNALKAKLVAHGLDFMSGLVEGPATRQIGLERQRAATPEQNQRRRAVVGPTRQRETEADGASEYDDGKDDRGFHSAGVSGLIALVKLESTVRCLGVELQA